VTPVDSAAAAVAALAHEVPDVLLSDLAMPGEDGIALLGRIRALTRDAGGTLPAAAMTAAESDEVRTRALAAGFACSLVKPLDPDHLVSVIGALAVRKSRAQKPARPKA
jgi:CheY-like chemotaxis protein